jgi:nuclear pore complex protein Nup133
MYFTLFSGAPSISPSEALVLPSKEEIMSRWPGLSTEQVDSLIMDYIFEQDQLEEFQLDDVYVRMKELVESDGGNIGTGDKMG